MTQAHDLIVQGGTVVTEAGRFAADVGVRGGVIVGVGSDLGDAVQRIDATGCLVMPGGVDAHAHIEQMSGMGLMNADTFETATRSAAMGGTTSVISFAAQARGQSLRDTVADYAARAARGAMIDHAFHITVTDLSVPGFDADLAALVGQGHRSLKVFTTYNIRLEDAEILRVMAAARAYGAIVCVHAEDHAMLEAAKKALLAAGHTAPHHHAAAHPRLAEIEAIERMCRLAEFMDQPVMIFHVSTTEGVDVVRAAQARGVPVWAETCPHYLLMTEDVLRREGLEGAKWMCSPPQRQAADQAALWDGLARGDLSLVSSDHAPYRYDASGKLSAGPGATFAQIANGMPGLEPRLPLMFDAMIRRGGLGAEAFVRITASEPARLYGLTGKGQIAPGMDADLVLWDPARTVTYGADDLHDATGYNPWEGFTVTGWPRDVILRGQVLVRDGEFLGEPGQGRAIPRPVPGVAPRGGWDA
jgi:dihydropyrimidinase